MRLRLIYGLMRRWIQDWTACLDFCGGGGVFHPTLGAAFQKVVSVDLEGHEASLVGQHYQLENVLLVRGDISELYLSQAPFPNIVAADVLEHFADLAVPVGALRKWLAPHGLLFTSLPVEGGLYVFLRKLFGETKPVDHYHTAYEVEKYLEANGFQRISRRCVPFVGPVFPLFSVCVWKLAPTPL